MPLHVIVGEINHGGRRAIICALRQRVDSVLDIAAQLDGLIACGRGGKHRETPDGVSALSGSQSIVEHKRDNAFPRDSYPEAWDLTVPYNGVSLLWWPQMLYRFFRDPCQHCVSTISK